MISDTLLSYVPSNAMNFMVFQTAIIIFPVLSLLFYITRWPAPRPVRPQRPISFRPSALPHKIDTIVIGSGSGGSTCANLLAQSGQRVLILEQHDRTGGCTHSFREENCEFDSGLHYTSKAMSQVTKRPGAIMDFMSRGKQHWTPLRDPYDEIIFPASEEFMCAKTDDDNKKKLPGGTMASYKFFSGEMNTVESIMNKISPNNDSKHLELKKKAMNYMNLCRDIHNGFVALGISRLLPNCLQFLVQPRIDRLMKFASMTVRDVQHAVLNLGYTAEELIRSGCPKAPTGYDPDPSICRMKGVLSHPIGDYAVQPREATMAAHGVTMTHYMSGASYTVGPTQNISMRNTSMVRSYGGEVLVDATVRDIIIENGRAVGVRVSNTSELETQRAKGEDASEVQTTEIRATYVVCATSVYNLYSKFLPQELPIVKKFHDPEERTIRQSHGHVYLFCKIDGDATELNLPAHNLWYFHRYDLDRAFDEYFANPTNVRPPTVYVGFPCTKDSLWKKRFPNTSNCILISDGLYEWFERWADKPTGNRGRDYTAFKEKLTKHLLDILYDLVPQVKGKVTHHNLGTPLSECDYIASYRGGSYGTKCTPQMFDPVNRKWTTTPHTQIPGLYLAGSDAFLPSVVGAMYGGCLGACAVLGHLKATRLGHALVCHLAVRLREENPKLSRFRAYWDALKIFTND